MSAPVLLAIVLNLQTTIQGISKAAGYHYDIKPDSVVLEPVSLLTVPGTEVPWVNVGHRIEPVHRDILGHGNPAVLDHWRIVLWSRIDALGNDRARKLTALLNFEADIEAAVVKAPWSHAGGPEGAQYTYVQQATRFMGVATQNICLVEIPIEVKFKRDYGVA